MNPICATCRFNIDEKYGPCLLDGKEKCYKGQVEFYGITLIPGHWYDWEDKPPILGGSHTSMYTGYFWTYQRCPEMLDRWGRLHEFHDTLQFIDSLKEVQAQEMSGLSVLQKYTVYPFNGS